MTQEEFTTRFRVRMLALAKRETFDDGDSIAEYADEVAESYFVEQFKDGLSPEECADADVSYWEASDE